jgi:hypothetical protein
MTSSIWDGQNAYILGGADDSGCLNQIIRFNTNTGLITITSIRIPSGRYAASAIWDGTNIYLFGGSASDGTYDFGYTQITKFNISTGTVTTLSAKLPSIRDFTSAIWDGTNVYIFGGITYASDGMHLLDQIIKFDPSTGTVTTLSAKLPTARDRTSAIWDGTNVYIFGVYGGDDQIVKFNPSTETVTALSARLPSGREFTSAVWDGTNAYIFGGYGSDSSCLDQIVKFNPSTETVTALSAKLPSGRVGTSAIWDGTNAYIFGGYDGNDDLDQIVKFNPSTKSVAIAFSLLSPVTIVVDKAKFPTMPTTTTTAYTETLGAYSVNWTFSTYATSYLLEENGIEIYNGTALSYSFTNKVDGDYTYRVKTWNTNGTSKWSSSVTITVDNAELPGVPSITTSSYTDTDGNYTINWTPSDYAAKYILDENGIEIYNGTNFSCSFTNKPNGTYSYRVMAWNITGTSGRSSPAVVNVSYVVSIPTNKIPSASISSISPNPAIYERNFITFVGAGSDTDGTIVEYLWESNISGVIGSSATFTNNSLPVGNHTITFKVKDNNNTWSEPVSATLTINTSGGNASITEKPPEPKKGFIPGFESIFLLLAIGVLTFIFIRRRK